MIKAVCEAYINGPCLAGLSAIIDETAKRNGLSSEQFCIESDPEDSQALCMRYPTATPEDAYISKTIKIESGAKSALNPSSDRIIRPYLESDIPGIDLGAGNITTIDPERTFWDKVVILHGLRSWFDNRGELKGNGQRVSRHYYDLHQLLASDTGQRALKNRELGADCATHARMFFNRPAFNLATAAPPTFSLQPKGKMLGHLSRDYRAMSGMIFGEAPVFEEIIDDIIELETALNAPTEREK